MIPINTAFWGLVFLFGLIGALRGWAREVMVAASVLLAMFTQQVIAQYLLGPQNPYLPLLLTLNPETRAPETYSEVQFYACTALLIALTFFGYAGPTLIEQDEDELNEQLQGALLGFFLGLLNGFLIIGALWFYMDKAGYGLGGISSPEEGSVAWSIAHNYLVPVWLPPSMLYLAVAVAFVLVIILFI